MIDTSPAVQNTFVRAIEPLRGFAAISVLILHVIYISEWSDFPKAGPLGWFWVGWLGVDIFFVISGFVVTMAACREMASDNKAPRIFFFIRRFARIAPLYFLSMAVYVFAVNSDPVTGSDAWLQVSTHFLFMHNIFVSTKSAIPPTWTIGTEMQLYLLVVLLMAWLPRFHPLLFALGIITVACVFRSIAYSMHIGESDAFLSHVTTQMPGMVDSFGLGVVLALLQRNGKLPALAASRWVTLFVLAVAGLAICEIILSRYEETYWQRWWLPTFFRSFAAVVCMALVWSAIAMPSKWQNAFPQFFVYLGQISYGIYLWHFMVILLLLKFTDLDELALLGSTLAITIAAATLSWVTVERPIVRATQRWLAGWRNSSWRQPGSGSVQSEQQQ